MTEGGHTGGDGGIPGAVGAALDVPIADHLVAELALELDQVWVLVVLLCNLGGIER